MKIKYIFYLEVVISVFAIFQAAFWPQAFLETSLGMRGEAVAGELARWYSVLLFFLMYIYMVSMHQRRWYFFRHVLIALLLGDVLHLTTTIVAATNLGTWSPGLFGSLGVTFLFAGSRMVALRKPSLIGRTYDFED